VTTMEPSDYHQFYQQFDESSLNTGTSVPDIDKDPRFSDYIYLVLLKPSRGMELINQNIPLLEGLAVYFFVQSLQLALNWQGITQTMASASVWLDGSFRGLGAAFAVLGLIISISLLFVNTAVINLTAQLFGGTGNGVSLLAAFSFASLPGLFGGIFNFIGARTDIVFVSTLAAIAVFVWGLILHVIAVEKCHGITTAKAFMVIILPFAVILTLVFFLFVLAATILPGL